MGLVLLILAIIIIHFLQAEQAYILAGQGGSLIADGTHFDFVMLPFALHLPLADLAIAFLLLNIIQFAPGAFDQFHFLFLLRHPCQHFPWQSHGNLFDHF